MLGAETRAAGRRMSHPAATKHSTLRLSRYWITATLAGIQHYAAPPDSAAGSETTHEIAGKYSAV